VVDVFVDERDLGKLGFAEVVPQKFEIAMASEYIYRL